MSKTKACIVVTVLVVVVAIFLVAFLPKCFQYVEYYEYGLLRQHSTGLTDRSKVFMKTRLARGPDFTFDVYTATVHHERLNDLDVATFDRVSIEISVSFQYFLRKENIVLLNDEYQDEYKTVVIERATDALKAQAPSFTVREYIDNRTDIETGLFLAIRQRLEGKCCYQSCKQRGTCLHGCRPMESCSLNELGVMVEVRYFQLLSVKIHDSIAERLLRSLIVQEKALKSELVQEAVVIRKETESLVRFIQNEAREIRVASETRSRLIQSQARTNKTAMLESARKEGLQNLYSSLHIEDEKHRNTFDYLRTLRHEERCHLTVDFQQRIAGNLK